MDLSTLFAIDPQRLLQTDMLIRFNLQILLLMASAFFSSSETALFSLSRLDLQKMRRDHNPRFDLLHSLLERPHQLIISILCGNQASDKLEVHLPSADSHTVGGMVISHLRHIPVLGEFIIQAGYRCIVEGVNDRGILKLRVERAD
ncbi:MAG: CNNM domain-containing protein [Gammaproteobacteria bacterium]|nr:CNNM domain-containing protein [Gammaproteobacteria bacterium]